MKLLVYRYGGIGDTLALSAFLASMRPVCEMITLLGPSERMSLIDKTLRDRIVSYDMAGDWMKLADEHDLSVAFRNGPLPGFTHQFPPLPPRGERVYAWLKARAMELGGADRDIPIPGCRGVGTIIAPGSGSARKNRPLEAFLEVARGITEPLFLLGPAESHDLDRRIEAAGFPVARPETLTELDRLVSARAVFHGNDSGPTHLAALRGLETHLHLVDPASRDWIPPGRVMVHQAEG